ncbi:MAG: undecaprenyl/decaprenyl-phosphate alpha-N-acetylglucosaminyl 1-phosphate transferase [Bacteroidaceae bacterium]|nr:undecaprenyl/decaprenyl-phosphate alpha-N-acetylglucosaminyl 1-phosphate transferase [Bacteroidaceae bacterium]
MLILIIVAFLSLIVTMMAYPFVLRYARHHKIVDNPDVRKLHRLPIPVMGGVAVYTGILAGCLAMYFMIPKASISWSIMAITFMLVLGVWDDIKNLPAVFRLIAQFGIVGAYMWFKGYYISNFFGLFGVHEISPMLGVPLSLVAGVGIINAINMIDGVDGYSSGYGIMASGCFAVLFITVHQSIWSCLAVAVASALIPFFFHNVFGKKSKMFIGDGGTMMLGFLMTIFGLGTLSPRYGSYWEEQGIGVIAMTLAIFCIPIFDTFRVMTARIMRGSSPFKPDKSHLHHLFIDMGFSHLGAAVAILLTNFIVILVLLQLWLCGASINVQTIVVILMGVTVTFGFYKLMRWQQHSGPVGEDGLLQGTALWRAACRMGKWSHIEEGTLWLVLQKCVDGNPYVRK